MRMAPVGDLAMDTAIEGSDGRYRAQLSRDWEIWGPNGGYLAVIALRAAGAHTPLRRPATFSCHYLGVADFDAVDLDVRTIRGSRRAASVAVSMTQDGRPVLVLAKKSPVTPEEVAKVKAHLEQNKNLAAIYLPDDLNVADPHSATAPPADADAFRHLIQSNQPSVFAAAYKFDVSPVFDSAPFFFFTLKTKDIARQIAGTRSGMDWKVNVGIVILGIVLVISIVAVVVFLILPLLLHSRSSAPHVPPLLYFVCLGLGYILVEITLIQRLVLFLVIRRTRLR